MKPFKMLYLLKQNDSFSNQIVFFTFGVYQKYVVTIASNNGTTMVDL